MGELNVRMCFKKFPSMTDNDMANLVGTHSYNPNTIVTATAVAHYNGKCSQPLSVFYAENTPQKFIPKLNETKQKRIMEQAHIDPEKVNATKEKTSANNNDYRHFGSNENNRSIFDIERERRKKKFI